MDQMSIAKILLVSVPENICNIYIAFLLTSSRTKLPFRDNPADRANNIFKLLLTVALFTITQYIERLLAPDMGAYFVANIISSILILGIVYNEYAIINRDIVFSGKVKAVLKTWKEPFIQVIIIFTLLYFIEIVYIPPVLQLLGITSPEELYKVPWANLVFPQVDRFIQILIITALWNYQRLNFTLLKYKSRKPLFLVTFVYIILVEFGFSYLLITGFGRLSIQLKLIFFVLLLCMTAFNLVLSKAILNIVDTIYKIERKG